MIILDTHIWIWYLVGSSELKKKDSEFIDQNRNKVAISSISVWEGVLLAERGKLSCSKDDFIQVSKDF